jgi:hypothetical protein
VTPGTRQAGLPLQGNRSGKAAWLMYTEDRLDRTRPSPGSAAAGSGGGPGQGKGAGSEPPGCSAMIGRRAASAVSPPRLVSSRAP